MLYYTTGIAMHRIAIPLYALLNKNKTTLIGVRLTYLKETNDGI